MKQPRLSVCMAVYNGARFIREQLQSILVELGDTDEVVIVDDGSGDETVSVLESFGDRRIRLIRNARNRGSIRAFEQALTECRGEYIFFSDQDDVWIRGKVKQILSDFHGRQCEAVVTDARVVDENLNTVCDSFFSRRHSGPGLVKNFYKNSYLGCSMAINANAKRYLLPFPATIVQHDEWIGLACNAVGEVYFSKKALLLYRMHEKNQTLGKRLTFGRSFLNRMKMACAVLARLPLLVTARYTVVSDVPVDGPRRLVLRHGALLHYSTMRGRS